MALKEYFKVDELGTPIEVSIFDDVNDEIPEDFILGWDSNIGFHTPIYDFTTGKWIEGKPNEEILAEIKAEKIEEINDICNEVILSGFEATNGHFYEFEEHDQANFSQMLPLLILDPNMNEIQWKTIDSGIVLHTRDEFIAVCRSAEAHKKANIGKYWTLKAQVEQATTIEEINAIDW